MTLLRIDASIQGDRSASSALADLVVDELVGDAGTTVVRRHLGQDPLPADAWAAAVSGGWTPEAERRTEAQRAALDTAAQLARELQEATAVVVAFPLYNFGISQHAKTWIDLAMAGAPHGTRLLDGTPTVLVVTRGGAYGPGTPREGWDHSTDYLRKILADTWGADLTVVEREFTLVGVNPALDEFTEIAALLHRTAEGAASEAGRSLAARRQAAGRAA